MLFVHVLRNEVQYEADYSQQAKDRSYHASWVGYPSGALVNLDWRSVIDGVTVCAVKFDLDSSKGNSQRRTTV